MWKTEEKKENSNQIKNHFLRTIDLETKTNRSRIKSIIDASTRERNKTMLLEPMIWNSYFKSNI